MGVMRMSAPRLLDALPRHAVAREGAARFSRRAVDGDYGRISARAKRVAADRDRSVASVLSLEPVGTSGMLADRHGDGLLISRCSTESGDVASEPP